MAAAGLAQILADRGRNEEATAFLKVAQETMFKDDLFVTIDVEIARAKIRARRGALAEAEEAAREGVRLARSTDAPLHTGLALATLGDVLRVAGRADEAASRFEEAARVYQRKGFTVAAARAQHLSMDVRNGGAHEIEGEMSRVAT